MKSQRIVAATLLFGSLLAGTRARAIEDMQTPRSLGTASSMRAAATGALGPLLNPAGMALVRQYDVELSYGLRVQDLGSSLYLAIVDSITSRLAAALYYQFVHSSPRFSLMRGQPSDQVSREGHETGLALALPVGDHFAIGVNARYVTVSTDIANPDPAGSPRRLTLDSTTSTAAADGFTIDTGLVLRLGDSLSLGVAGTNLIPLRSVEAPTTLGIGLSYQAGTALTVAVDTGIYFGKYLSAPKLDAMGHMVPGDGRTTVRVGAGLEYLAGGVVPIRLGYSWDNGLPGSFLSGGLGYVSNSFGLDVAYRQKVSGGSDSMMMVSIRLFLQ